MVLFISGILAYIFMATVVYYIMEKIEIDEFLICMYAVFWPLFIAATLILLIASIFYKGINYVVDKIYTKILSYSRNINK